MRYSKEGVEVVPQRWKHAVDMLTPKPSREADELLR